MDTSKKNLTQEQLKKRSVKQLIALAKNDNYTESTQISAIITAANRKTFDKKENADLIGRYEAYKKGLEDKRNIKKSSKKSTKSKSKEKLGFGGKPRGRFDHPEVGNGDLCMVEIKGEKLEGELLYCNRNSSEYCVVIVGGKKYEKSLSKVTKFV